MHESFDPTTIIFALLAAFVLWKLRSVLGERNGEEKQRGNPFLNPPRGAPQRQGEASDNVIRLPGAPEPVAASANENRADSSDRWKGFAEPGSKAWAGLDAIAAADRSFALQPFLNGAKTAYEMIISAFAAGDRETLEGLLATHVYNNFAAAIAEREKRGEKVETTLVSINEVSVEDAALRGRAAEITLRFAAEMITATRDQNGAVIEGSSDRVTSTDDVWTFTRDAGSRDPNWRLTATGAEA